MIRRIVVSVVLAAVLVIVQLVSGRGWGLALVTGLVALVVAYLVLLVSDRYFVGRR